jgi:hypothetical protein
MVRMMMHLTTNPLGGLVMVKLIAVGLGVYCWKVGRSRLLGRINILFAVVITWNLAALILSAA